MVRECVGEKFQNVGSGWLPANAFWLRLNSANLSGEVVSDRQAVVCINLCVN